MSYTIKWADALNNGTIETFEHPIYNCFISKDEYSKEFGPILELLNGDTMTDYIDFYYERDSILQTSFKFIGENEKLDFYDWAVEYNCLPSLVEIHEGESTIDKNKRNKQQHNLISQEIQKQKQKQAHKQNKSIQDKELHKINSIKKNIENILNKPNISQNKIEKATDLLISIYNNYKTIYGIIPDIESYINVITPTVITPTNIFSKNKIETVEEGWIYEGLDPWDY